MNRHSLIAVLLVCFALGGCAAGPPSAIGGPAEPAPIEAPQQQPVDRDPGADGSGFPGRAGSDAARGDNLDKLSDGLRRAFEDDPFAPTVNLTAICNPVFDRESGAPPPLQVAELIVNFDERMRDFEGVAPESFELVPRETDPDRFFAVWRHRGVDREADTVFKDDILQIAGDDRVAHIEPNCRYPQPRVYRTERRSVAGVAQSACRPNLATCPVIPAPPFPPNDVFFENKSLWGLESMGVYDPWSSGITQSEKLIAVIDTGINYEHEDLRNIVWTNPGEMQYPDDEVDNDSNGYTDDLHGFAFANDCDPADVGNSNCDPMPGTGTGTGHGTFAASIIGAEGDNAHEANSATVGVAWKSRIVAIRVGTHDEGFSNSQLARAIGYARTIGAKIINISLTTNLTYRDLLDVGNLSHWPGNCCNSSHSIGDQIRKTPNALFVAASGRNYPKYPAAFPYANIISVSGIMRHDCSERHAEPDVSARHPTGVDISAPSVQICGIDRDHFALSTGVSWAAPHVSGAAALAWSVPYSRRWTPEQIKDLLIRTARWSPHLRGWSVSEGALDIGFMSGFRWNAKHLTELVEQMNSQR